MAYHRHRSFTGALRLSKEIDPAILSLAILLHSDNVICGTASKIPYDDLDTDQKLFWIQNAVEEINRGTLILEQAVQAKDRAETPN